MDRHGLRWHRRRARVLAVLLATGVVIVAIGPCTEVEVDRSLEGSEELTTTTATVTTSSSTSLTSVSPSTVGSPVTVALPGPRDPLVSLVVAEEHLPGYDRDLFEHWSDVDRDGCNTRCEVLAEERRPDVGWLSIYDGFVTSDPAEIQIDHVVALAEAWRSGAWRWDDARRKAFANDLDEPGALMAVSGASNQSKADKDPGEWRPQRREAWCPWARATVAVKAKWGLTVDPREADALERLLEDC